MNTQLVQDKLQIQFMPITISITNFTTRMNILFIIQVNILLCSRNSHTCTPPHTHIIILTIEPSMVGIIEHMVQYVSITCVFGVYS